MVALKINGKDYELDVDPSTPLLWTIREQTGLTGTKFGCGVGQCGACTILLDGQPVRGCLTPAALAEGKEITTIEGLSTDEASLSVVQQVWIEEQVPQCGYCQSGQIMSATALLNSNASPTDEDIDVAMRGNICRCGTYPRIKKAIKKASEQLSSTINLEQNG